LKNPIFLSPARKLIRMSNNGRSNDGSSRRTLSNVLQDKKAASTEAKASAATAMMAPLFEASTNCTDGIDRAKRLFGALEGHTEVRRSPLPPVTTPPPTVGILKRTTSTSSSATSPTAAKTGPCARAKKISQTTSEVDSESSSSNSSVNTVISTPEKPQASGGTEGDDDFLLIHDSADSFQGSGGSTHTASSGNIAREAPVPAATTGEDKTVKGSEKEALEEGELPMFDDNNNVEIEVEESSDDEDNYVLFYGEADNNAHDVQQAGALLEPFLLAGEETSGPPTNFGALFNAGRGGESRARRQMDSRNAPI
jgi:hypothetical protein